jgi:hypothetical protein
MRFRQPLAAAIVAAAGVVSLAGLSAAPARAATTTVTLPITTYSHMLVDPANQHIFITSGAGSTSILVVNYAGQTVTTIPNEAGATGLALSSDGSTVYAALQGADAVSAISTSTLAETARYDTGTGTDPTYVAYTSGKIWFGYGAAAQGGIGSIDPSTSPATVTLNAVNAAINTWYAAPMLSATASGELVAGEPGQSPDQLASWNVSSGTATVLAPSEFIQSAGNLKSMAITPDGTDVVTASGSPYDQQIFQVSDLSAVGSYPTTFYPEAVSIANDGTVAAGTGIGNNEVFIFSAGASTPLNTFNFGDNWLASDGVALTPDGTELFAVTLAGGSGGTPTLNIIPNPKQPTPDSTTTAVTCSPGTVAIGQPTTCTATVTDTASSGATTPTGTVSFTSDTSGGSFSGGGSCALAAASTAGQASCSLSYTPGQIGSGTQTITGSYAGDTTHAASSGQGAITVTLRTTTTALACPQQRSALVKCTATVSDTSPGTAITPTGTVSFTTNSFGIFSATKCTLSGSGATASCAVYYGTLAGFLGPQQTITASYGGDSTHLTSSGSTKLK